MKRYLMSLVLCGVLMVSTSAFAADPAFMKIWTAILKDNVSRGVKNDVSMTLLDYKKVKMDPRFFKVLEGLTTYDPSQLKYSKEKLAFWINAYNIAAVKVVKERYPMESIKDISTFVTPVWDKEAITIGGKIYTLGDIEHKVLRPIGMPLIHVAIVCASVSCPDLRNEAYRARDLNRQLQSQLKRFLDNPKKGMVVNHRRRTVKLSLIFKWFAEDFEQYGGVLPFLSNSYDRDISRYRIEYLPYDWSLNDIVPKATK
ncbi:DUF547 domain-containing protein [bacterium]|jgi:hypothetical protein|nr:DUF547 domain-containing protein [bacterium]